MRKRLGTTLALLLIMALIPLIPVQAETSQEVACTHLFDLATDIASRKKAEVKADGESLLVDHDVICQGATTRAYEAACADLYDIAYAMSLRSGTMGQHGNELLADHQTLCVDVPASTTTTVAETTTTFGDTTTSSTTTTIPATTTTTEVTTTTTTVPVTTTTTMPTSFSCNRLISMSQGRQTMEGFRAHPGVDVSKWEASIHGGALLWKWTDPNYEGWSDRRWNCSGELQRVVFLFDPINSDTKGAGFEQDLHTVIGHIHTKFPSVVQIDLILLVGSVDSTGAHQLCDSVQVDKPGAVRSSSTHAIHAEAGWVEAVADSYADVVMGPELHIPCSGYSDYVGHLTEAGKAAVGHQMAYWYGYDDTPYEEPPVTTTSTSTTTTTSTTTSTTTTTQPTEANTEIGLGVSTNADRSSSSSLNGSTLSGPIYIFFDAIEEVDWVVFSLDGNRVRRENDAPYDLNGGTVELANPFQTETLVNGQHEVNARVRKIGGETVNVTATFTVNN